MDRLHLREFLVLLRQQRIHLTAEGEDLRCTAPPGTLSEDIRQRLVELKPEILSFLRVGTGNPTSLVTLQAGGPLPPLFAVPGHTEDAFCWVRLARHLSADQPLLALEPLPSAPEAPGQPLPELARRCLRDLRQRQPHGPYFLLGHCWGGTLAFELACQLVGQGERVAFLGLVEAPGPSSYAWPGRLENQIRVHYWRLRDHLEALRPLPWPQRWAYLTRALGRLAAGARLTLGRLRAWRRGPAPVEAGLDLNGARHYRPHPYPGPVHYFFCSALSHRQHLVRQGEWRRWAASVLVEEVGPPECHHNDLLLDPYAGLLAERVTRCLAQARG